jgi:hypothetical protein
MLALWLAAVQAVDAVDLPAAAPPPDLTAATVVAWYHDPIKIAFAVIVTCVVAMVVLLATHGDAIIRD